MNYIRLCIQIWTRIACFKWFYPPWISLIVSLKDTLSLFLKGTLSLCIVYMHFVELLSLLGIKILTSIRVFMIVVRRCV